jgi:hypothetical protein
MMEQEDESQLALLDPHKQTVQDLQVFMLQHIEQGFTINPAMDGNKSGTHSFQAPTVANRITTPLGFNYNKQISVSIADMLKACELVNIHTLQHGEAPPTHKHRSRQTDFMFISR